MALFGVAIDERVAERIATGVATVPLASLADAPGLEPGRPVRLLDRKGAVVASGLVDSDNGVLRVYARQEVAAMDQTFFTERVSAALAMRQALGLVDGTTAFRAVHGDGDGLGGFFAEVFPPYGVVWVLGRALLPQARLVAEGLRRASAATASPVTGVVVKVRARKGRRGGDRAAGAAGDGGGDGPDDHDGSDDAASPTDGAGDGAAARIHEEIVGERPPERHLGHEAGLSFEVHLTGSLNVGLFLDMREHRRGLSRFVRDLRVLNTFAYTGSLTVAAARAGARTVTSVDLAAGVLDWTRTNLRLCGLDPDGDRFRFEVADVMRFLDKEASAGRRHDTVILDPPTVSAARATSWSARRDWPELATRAARVIDDRGGFLWMSGNTLRGAPLLPQVTAGVRAAGRGVTVLEQGGLPPDFPTLAHEPGARYLEHAWLRVGPR